MFIMARFKWIEVFKFLSGFAAASFLTTIYLYFTKASVPFLGYTISPELLGLRALINLVLFGLFFYFGFAKRK